MTRFTKFFFVVGIFFLNFQCWASPFFSNPQYPLGSQNKILWTGTHLEFANSIKPSPQVGFGLPLNSSFLKGSLQTDFNLLGLNLSNRLFQVDSFLLAFSVGSHLGSGGSLSPWAALNTESQNLLEDYGLFLSGGMFLGSFSLNKSLWDAETIQNIERSFFYYFGTQAQMAFFPDPNLGIHFGIKWIPWTRFAKLSSPLFASLNFSIYF